MDTGSNQGALLPPGNTENAMGTHATSYRSEVKMASPIELAVVWVEKAKKGSDQWFDEMPEAQIRIYRLRKRVKGLVHVVMCLYLCLALFEQPSWCLGDAVPCANLFHDMPNAGLPVFPFQISNSLEIVFLLVLSFRTWLRWRSLAGEHSGGWTIFLLVCLCLAFADCVVAIFNIKGVIPGNFRLARLCRPLVFLACYKKLREAVARVLRSIPNFANVLLSLAIGLVLFTWVGIILFSGGAEGDNHFASWPEGLASMWILFTTANNPDVWLDAYHSSRWSFWYFFIYLIFSLYLLNNILLAAVYDGYKDKLIESLRHFFRCRNEAIRRAFNLLADSIVNGERVISEEAWISFFSYYCDGHFGGVSLHFSSQDRMTNRDRAQRAFSELDTDHNDGLSLHEFKSIVDFFHDPSLYIYDARLYERIRYASRARHFFGVHVSRIITKGVVVRGHIVSWDSVVDGLIFVDIALTFACTLIFVGDHHPREKFSVSVWRHGGPWFWISLCFSCFYIVETSIKVSILGLEQFWYSKPFMHRYDCLIVLGLAALQVVYTFGDESDLVIRIYLLFRIARTLRLLSHVKSLRHLAGIMMNLIPTFQRLVFMLLIVCYMYATIGMQVFGGLITEGNKDLVGTDFANLGYYDLNFNDFFSSMVTLFVLMIVNNWFVIADGFLHVTGSAWSQVFFVSFYVVVNMIVLNVLVSLILDCFAPLREDFEKQDEVAVQRAAEGESDQDGLRESSPARSRHVRADRESVLRRVLLASEVDTPSVEGEGVQGTSHSLNTEREISARQDSSPIDNDLPVAISLPLSTNAN